MYSKIRAAAISGIAITLMVIGAPVAQAQGLPQLPPLPNINPETAIGTILGSLSSMAVVYLLVGTVYNYFARQNGKKQHDGSYIPKF